MKQPLFIFLMLSVITTSKGQATLKCINENAETREQAYYSKKIIADPQDQYKATEITYWETGKIKSEEPFRFHFKYDAPKSVIKAFLSGKRTINDPIIDNAVLKSSDGRYKEWKENGQLYKEIDFQNGAKNGQSIIYWDNEHPKRVETFEKDRLISGKCFNQEGKEISYTPFRPRPEFPGGNYARDKFIKANMRYPVTMMENNIKGVFKVKFTVKKDGQLTDIEVAQKDIPGLYQEVARLISLMPNWLPALREGEFEPIDSKYSLPLTFMMK